MGIYKRGRIWWFDFFDQNKKRVFESSHSPSRREAERLLAIRQADVGRGQYQVVPKISLGDFSEKYMVFAKANKASWDRDAGMLKHIRGFFGNRNLTDVSPMDVEEYKVYRSSLVEKSTVNRELALLKHMFNLALAWDLYPKANPLRKVKFFREDNVPLRTLSIEEEERFMRSASPYIQDIARFALNTGMRIGEVFNLRWDRVDLEQGIITVLATKTGKIRKVPINEVSERILQYWNLGRRNEHVFYNHETGAPLCDLKAGFLQACKKAGITGVTWHTLRHTFASRLVNRGSDIVTVKELLGHSTVTVTMRYAHTNMDSKRDAVQNLVPKCDNSVTMTPKSRRGLKIVTRKV
jgi:integrase